ncbi:MAG: hypothetical protein LH679_12445 [Cyanobacteria bacterium CAN_BIN43]|nr:hypothetical protein [Cyanobacteria bacterium CAN_BIN43]
MLLSNKRLRQRTQQDERKHLQEEAVDCNRVNAFREACGNQAEDGFNIR